MRSTADHCNHVLELSPLIHLNFYVGKGLSANFSEIITLRIPYPAKKKRGDSAHY